MTQATETTYDTPEAITTGALALAADGPKAFLFALAGDEPLFAAIVKQVRRDDLWLDRVIGQLRTQGVTVADTTTLRSNIRKRIQSQERAERAPRTSLRTVGPEDAPPLVRAILGTQAPVHDDAVVPAGFLMTRTGLATERANAPADAPPVAFAPDPMLITRRLIDADSGDELVTVAWPRDEAWRELTVRRSQVASRSDVVKLADKGLPVDSGTAPDVVTWFSRYEATNRPVIPVGAVSSHLGWQGTHGERGFLVGRRLITTDGHDAGEISASEPPAPGTTRLDIAFHGSDAGDEELADGLSTAGTMDGWKAAITAVAAYPRVRFMLCASFAAPLLHILGLDTFFVDSSGMTSTGKTTTLRLSASVWGQPNPSRPGSMLGSWNASPTYIERRAALFNGIPVLLDDSKQASDPEFVARMIYDLASGQGKGRGTVGGLRRSERWRTVVLTTGEQRLIDFTQDGGTRGRVITLWGPPFGPPSRETSYLVNRLPAALETDHGHAGPAFIAYLLRHREQWVEWCDEWRGEVDAYATIDANNPIIGRLGGFLGSIYLATRLAHDAGLFPWSYADPIAPVWDDILRQGQEADRALAAMQDVASWAVMNEQSFLGRHITDGNGNAKMPAGGWFGKWSDQHDWETIALAPPRLDAFLRQQGYDKSILGIWRDRGWLDTGKDTSRHMKKVRFDHDDHHGAGSSWCYVLRREALEQ